MSDDTHFPKIASRREGQPNIGPRSPLGFADDRYCE